MNRLLLRSKTLDESANVHVHTVRVYSNIAKIEIEISLRKTCVLCKSVL